MNNYVQYQKQKKNKTLKSTKNNILSIPSYINIVWRRNAIVLWASRVWVPAQGPFPIPSPSLSHFAFCLLFTVLS